MAPWPVVRYLQFQLAAVRAGARERWRPPRAGGHPLPPPRLRYRVHGALDAESFVEVGRACARDLHRGLAAAGRDLYAMSPTLDFGCGCGRTAARLDGRPTGWQLHGTDADRRAIRWCRTQLAGVAEWSANAVWPPTAYSDGHFECVYAISVFTHLDEPLQRAWLIELKRIVRPGGVVVITLNGSRMVDLHRSVVPRAELDGRGFAFVRQDPWLKRREGLPDHYHATFQTRAYVEREWSPYFTVAAYLDGAMNTMQDVAVLVKGT